MEITNLDGMKRAELQKLAKKAGIKANKKTGQLISELKKHYAKSGNDGESTTALSQSETETASSSQTDGSQITTEFETATESEPEAKPKSTRGRRGRKATNKPKKATQESNSETDMTTDEETEEHKQEVLEGNAETLSYTKKATKVKRGRRGHKRAVTSPSVTDVTPAKVAKTSTVQQEISVTPTPTVPAAENTKQNAESFKGKTTATVSKMTPQIEAVTTATTRGSSGRRAAKKTATAALDKPMPINAKITPHITNIDTKKTATRSSSGRKTSKRRRSTFEIDPATGTTKPAAKAKEVKKIKKLKSDPKMKAAAILAEIEKKVEDKKVAQPTTRIPKPRFGKSTSKPVTPSNWAKIHAAKMAKMESIDDYLERKRKRTENMTVSVKRAKIIVEEAKAAMETLKAHRTPPVKGSQVRAKASKETRKTPRTPSSLKGKQGPKIAKSVNKPTINFMSPHPTSNGLKSRGTASFASPVIKGSALKTPVAPQTATKNVTFKVSKLKTPKPALASKTAIQKRISTPGPIKSAVSYSGRKSVGDAAETRRSGGDATEKRKSLVASTRKSFAASARKSISDAASQRKSVAGGITPFKFGSTHLDVITPATKKSVFNIKASLKKGLTYKPHTGKLKPLEEKNFNFTKPKTNAINKAKGRPEIHANIAKAKAELKRPKVTSREERRAGTAKHRACKRGDNVMARRGIQM